MKKLFVKVGDMKAAKDSSLLITLGLGSCVAVTIYEPEKKIGALLHFLLPEGDRNGSSPFKYGDKGIEMMVKALENLGAQRNKMVAKLFGGALMFAQLIRTPENSIGVRNLKKAREVLNRLNIPIVGEDTNGDYGRSIEFNLKDGSVRVSSYKAGVEVI